MAHNTVAQHLSVTQNCNGLSQTNIHHQAAATSLSLLVSVGTEQHVAAARGGLPRHLQNSRKAAKMMGEVCVHAAYDGAMLHPSVQSLWDAF